MKAIVNSLDIFYLDELFKPDYDAYHDDDGSIKKKTNAEPDILSTKCHQDNDWTLT